MFAIELYKNHCEEAKSYSAGKTIFESGQQGECMYAVASGEVEIRLGETVIETVGQGGIFGEMALIDCRERSATAIAKTDCSLIAVNKDCFVEMIRETPFFALDVMHVMADRLRKTDRSLKAMS